MLKDSSLFSRRFAKHPNARTRGVSVCPLIQRSSSLELVKQAQVEEKFGDRVCILIGIQAEARASTYRMASNGQWRRISSCIGHLSISDKLDPGPVIDMAGDSICPKYRFETHFQVCIKHRTEWRANWMDQYRKGGIWFTDSSKMDCGTGSGVYGVKPEVLIERSLGRYATVFQAEVFAIKICAEENLRMEPRNLFGQPGCTEGSCILQNDLFPGLGMQEGPRTTGAAQQSSIGMGAGSRWIEGNEKADHLARNGCNTPFIGLEPVLGITRGSVRAALRDWIRREHEKNWVMCPGVKHSKTMMPWLCKQRTKETLCLGRNQITLITGLFTGHGRFRKHLRKVGLISSEPLCRLCHEEEETASHLLFDCVAIERLRYETFGTLRPKEIVAQKELVG
ncbi:uncharacterized protein isoform X2 [Rhodnius prolixus]|uniref:uncharacterized protein isoform X2 n=1 Tax=Rhodnius prolixus TaxID=13249 RepID=UPI003D18DFE2